MHLSATFYTEILHVHYKLFRTLFVIIAVIVIAVPRLAAQRVGVVLSGGGATALSHVGFLRALEENHIPIDCIGGTSMGAVIAAMYASGYSAAEIDSITRSDEFYRMSTGELDDQLKFYFKSEEPNAGMARIRYGEGKFISNALPANLIDPTLLDWKFMEGFSAADMASKDNFDSLFVPFRCLASDVEHKSQIIFRNGPLNIAVRASCTYPFYLPPLKIGGTLLYDGGIFNNFPADIMYMEFMPDVIIGCNVSGEISSPSEDDLFSQLQTMILFRDTPQQICPEMVVIKPKLDDVGTFDWDESAKAIDTGYKATLDSIAVIKGLVSREVSAEELRRKRWAFKRRQQPLIVEDVKIEGLSKSQRNYVRNMLGRNEGAVPVSALKKPYFRVFEDDKVKSIFPTLRYNPVTGKYIMHLDVRKEKNLFLTVGGLFSSRSINTGYLGLKYNLFGSSSFSLEGNSYFGRFYGSGYASVRWDVAGKFPLSISGIFCQNRWDYYRSLSTFFEDVKPSFVLLNERFGGLSFTAPAGNKGMIRAESIYTYQFDEYYQTQNFLSKDTADRTNFEGMVSRIYYERNTLNRRQYASSGTFLRLSFKHVMARETSIPGSTSALRDTTRSDHQWITAKLTYQNYFFRKRSFHLGVLLEGVASTQDFFSNYLASAIAAPAFQPIPESRTLFLPQFRAHNYASGGLQAVLALGKNLDLRAETYVFSAFGRILDNSADQAEYSFSIVPVYIASTSAVYHSPFGPVSLTANYYDLKEKPWSIVFNFGYILFNRSPRD